MKDVLDLFGDLPDYPGKTKPKNRTETKKAGRDATEDPFYGVPSRMAKLDGKMIELFTVGAVGKVIGRSATTVRQWESKGWIPSPKYRTSKASGSASVNSAGKGYRLYSRAQVETLRETLGECNLLPPRSPSWQESSNWLSFIEKIKAKWPD